MVTNGLNGHLNVKTYPRFANCRAWRPARRRRVAKRNAMGTREDTTPRDRPSRAVHAALALQPTASQ